MLTETSTVVTVTTAGALLRVTFPSGSKTWKVVTADSNQRGTNWHTKAEALQALNNKENQQ